MADQSQAAPATSAPAQEAKKSSAVVKDPRVDTALHIIKGAIVQVLNTPLTVSVQFTSATKGRITVEYAPPEKPTAEQIQRIEDLTNQKIKENLQPQHFTISRVEAEERFKDGVNGTPIYDKFKVPATVTEVTVVLWEGWNVNCCRGPHSPSGELGHLKIERVNHRDRKKELEFCFALVDPSLSAAASSGVQVVSKAAPASTKGKAAAKAATTQAKPADASPVKKVEHDRVPEVTAKVIDKTWDHLLAYFKDSPEIRDRLQNEKEKIALRLDPTLQSVINTLKVNAYSNGFQAGKTAH